MMKDFSERLKNAMQELHLTQTQVVGMTGCSKASISQYLSGKNVPTEMKQRDIAVSLGLNEDYFEQAEDLIHPKKIATADHIERMTTDEAAKLMGVNHHTVKKGLQQGLFPWGYAIKTSENRYVYFINKMRFMKIEVEGAVI